MPGREPELPGGRFVPAGDGEGRPSVEKWEFVFSFRI